MCLDMKVSVIVPVYNVEAFIDRCLNSLFSQTLDEIEYILIDDCSTDNSVGKIEDLIDLYPNRKNHVHLVRLTNNIGVAAVRQLGLQMATGEYVIFCDSDDWVDPRMYECLYGTSKTGDYDIIFCDYNIVDEAGQTTHIHQRLPDDKSMLLGKVLSGRIHSSLCNKMIRRTLYNSVNYYPKGNMREDLSIIIQLLYVAARIYHIPKSYYNYCLRNSSVSFTKEDSKIITIYEQSQLNCHLIEKFVSSTGLNLLDSLMALQLSIKVSLWKISDKSIQKKLWNDEPLRIPFGKLITIDIPLSYKIKYLIMSIWLRK